MKTNVHFVTITGLATLALAGVAAGGLVCVMNTQPKCCSVVQFPPETGSGCANDPPGANCNDLILANPTISYVVSMASGGFQHTDITAGTDQECRYQIRNCNSAGHCATLDTMTFECHPSTATLGEQCEES